ncbi:FAE1/Type III polyketide synthase-like protein-domain-containing protein [Scenedesmus sp. NREL 46B-D3]|nr:FAE1/Type III polyketide synthase-like protein-domain-containing protein [Scenedesmus sp. NREL 46B-D3]
MYLIDFYNFKPPAELLVNRDESQAIRVNAAKTSLEFRRNAFNTDSVDEALDLLDFCYKIVSRSGLSENGTYLPKAIHPKYSCVHPKTSIDDAMDEARMVMCGAIEGLLKKQGLAAKDVDIIVTTCSIFCPTPSLASMVVNHFGMRPDVQSYHLGGMGCSNGVVAVNLVKDLLRSRRNCNAILLTTEITTPAYYKGKDKHRQVTNMIFRTGASAVLFSNKRAMVRHAKYVLATNYRVHLASRDPAYKCIWYGPDEEGNNGIYLGKDVVNEASRSLSMAMFKVAPSILNAGQIAAYAATELQRKVLGRKVPAYKPVFTECLDHFLIHAGGAKVLDGIGKELQLDEAAMEPSRMVLHDYGNVSSSTTWYTLGYVESVRGAKKGDRLLQIGVGSGIKCGVNVWRAVRDVHDVQDAWVSSPRTRQMRTRTPCLVPVGVQVLLLADARCPCRLGALEGTKQSRLAAKRHWPCQAGCCSGACCMLQ